MKGPRERTVGRATVILSPEDRGVATELEEVATGTGMAMMTPSEDMGVELGWVRLESCTDNVGILLFSRAPPWSLSRSGSQIPGCEKQWAEARVSG